MKATMKFGAALLAGTLALGTAAFAEGSAGRYDAQIQDRVTQQLAKKSALRGVRSTVQDGIVTLSGAVDQYKYKLEAEKSARKQKNVAGVRDLVEVSGPAVSDMQLRDQVARKLAYDRVGYDNLFNVLNVGVQNGVVTLTGEVRTSHDKDSALAEIASIKGVKDVVDQVKVSPASIFDDELRVRVARAIYRDPVMLKYAMDPAAPIRILVDNGHVGLYGAVDSTLDRQVAFMRASQVFGAFSVENHLVTPQDLRG